MSSPSAEEQRVELLARDLESGEFRQAKERLRTDAGYCCLGVACERYRRETGLGRWYLDDTHSWWFITEATGEYGSAGTLPYDVAIWYGFRSRDGLFGNRGAVADNPWLPLLGDAAAGANDSGKAFAEIAEAFRDGWGPGSHERYPGSAE